VHEKFKPGLSEALLDRLCGGSGGLSSGGVDVAEFAPCFSDASFQPWRAREMKKSVLLVIDLQREAGSVDESMTHIAGIGIEKILEHARLLIEQARADGIQAQLSLCAASSSAMAANAPDPQGTEESGAIQEIVVTATQREENISKVPISITALSGPQLEERGITSITSLVGDVPGVDGRGRSR